MCWLHEDNDTNHSYYDQSVGWVTGQDINAGCKEDGHPEPHEGEKRQNPVHAKLRGGEKR
jgi:hypothetical protein